MTDADGEFVMTTFAHEDGAIIGEHVVTITAFEDTKPAGDVDDEFGSLSASMERPKKDNRKWIVPERYSDRKTSDLKFEVKSGDKNQADFPLNSK